MSRKTLEANWASSPQGPTSVKIKSLVKKGDSDKCFDEILTSVHAKVRYCTVLALNRHESSVAAVD